MAFTVGAPVRLVVRAAKHVNPKATKHHTSIDHQLLDLAAVLSS